MRITYEKVRAVTEPELVHGGRALKVFSPISMEEVVCMPGDDCLIPTGLKFPDLFYDYTVQSLYLSLFSKEAGVGGGLEREEQREGRYVLMIPTYIEEELFIHIINVGKTEVKVKPDKPIAYLTFHKIERLEIGEEEEDDGGEENPWT